MKGIYEENLDNIYTDIYDFVRVLGFSAEYVEKITPNEREIYKQKYKKEVEQKNKNNETQYDGTIGQGIQTN